MSVPEARVVRFRVETFNTRVGKWQSINDRIFLRDYMKPNVTYEGALALARAEADKQVSGWSAGYPLRQYRAMPYPH